MPRFNGTGPEGKGPLTGRGLGNCDSKVDNKTTVTIENDTPNVNLNSPVDNFNRGMGLGRGLGMGRGSGMGRGCQRGLGRGFNRGTGRGRGRGLGRGNF